MILSIIIPHYNDNKNLNFLLNEISNIQNTEVIVIDDCSKKTPTVNNNITLITNQKRNNAGYCRNIGINISKGKYLLFVDSDDILDPEICKLFIDKYLNRNLDVVFFRPEDDKQNKLTRVESYNSIMSSYLKTKSQKSENDLRYKFYVPWCKFVKKEFLVNNKIYFDNLLAGNDIVFSLKVGYLMKKFDIIDKFGLTVRYRENSLVTSFNYEIIKSRFISNINYNRYLEINKINLKKLKTFNYLIKAIRLKPYDYMRFLIFFLKNSFLNTKKFNVF